MKQVKPKSHRNQLAQQFKEKCKDILKQDPKNYLVTAFKDNALVLDISTFTAQDIPAFQIILTLPLPKIHIFLQDASQNTSPSKNKNNSTSQVLIKTFPQTPKFKDFMQAIGQSIQENSSIRILKLERIPLTQRVLKELAENVRKTKTLRELSLSSCRLAQQHLEVLKGALAQNQSLITLDLSGNALCDVGSMIGKILSEHSRRRSELIWLFNLRGEVPAQDISSSGLCEISLQGNLVNDKAITELVVFLRDDAWTKCINLRRNQIKTEGVKQLALMLKNNNSLISLDLRENEGLSKEYSRYIYKKLVLNMDKYKQQREKIQMRRGQNVGQTQNTPIKSSHKDDGPPVDGQYCSHRYEDIQKKEYASFMERGDISGNKLGVGKGSKVDGSRRESNYLQCVGCKQKTFQLLRLEKQNLDLQLQLRKVKNVLLTKNIDISAILPNPRNGGQCLSNRSNEGQDEMLQRMQQIMMELTRVIETIEQGQVTNGHISNPLDNPNSFSNTVQLYNPNSQLQDLSKQIADERMGNQQLLEGATSIDHKIDDI